eukprot:EG_transcript_2338
MPPPPSNNLTVHLRCPGLPSPLPVVLLRAWVARGDVPLIVHRVRAALLAAPGPAAFPDPFALSEQPDPPGDADAASSSAAVVPFDAVQHRGTYWVVPSAGFPLKGFRDLDYPTLPAPTTKGQCPLSEGECRQLWVLLKSLNQPDKESIRQAMRAVRGFLLDRLVRRAQHLTAVMRRFVVSHDDPAALVHLAMALSDVVFRQLRLEEAPLQPLLAAVPYLFAAIHRKVGPQWRRMLWQVVEVWDSRPAEFPERLRFETRNEVLLHGTVEESPDAALVTFDVPDLFLPIIEHRLREWGEAFCAQFGHTDSVTCDPTGSPATVTARFDRHASGLQLQQFLFARRYDTSPFEFHCSVEAVPGPLTEDFPIPEGPIAALPPFALVRGGALEWPHATPHLGQGSPSEVARRTPVDLARAGCLRWATLLDGSTPLNSANLVPLGPNLGLVTNQLFYTIAEGPVLLPHHRTRWQPLAWTALQLSRGGTAPDDTPKTYSRGALRVSRISRPVYDPFGKALGKREWPDVVLIWFAEDIFGDVYFHLHADTPLPRDTLTFLALHRPPGAPFAMHALYPQHAAGFCVPVPTAAHPDGSRTLHPDALPRAERRVALAQLAQLRDEYVAAGSAAAGSWAHPALLACPTRWIYQPEDPAAFGARVTAFEGACGGVLVPHNAEHVNELVGFFLGVPGPSPGTSIFLDPHDPPAAALLCAWLWPSLRRRPHPAALRAFLRYLDRHCPVVRDSLRRPDGVAPSTLTAPAHRELLAVCERLEEGLTPDLLVEAILNGTPVEALEVPSSVEESSEGGSVPASPLPHHQEREIPKKKKRETNPKKERKSKRKRSSSRSRHKKKETKKKKHRRSR